CCKVFGATAAYFKKPTSKRRLRSSVMPISPALRSMLDGILSHLFAGPHHDLAIDCLTNLLASDGKAVSLDDFPGLEHRLMNLDGRQLFALAVRWFATGDRKLCEGMTKLIGAVHQPQ